jgi:N-acetylneuraminate synthase
MDAAKAANVDLVKFQKRSPRMAVPKEQWGQLRSTPWGTIPYIEYKEKLEFGKEEFDAIAAHSRRIGIPYFASAWDIPAAKFLMHYSTQYIKVPSAKAADIKLLDWLSEHNDGRRVILSTGMSNVPGIDFALAHLTPLSPILMHCTSTYPCPHEELNLRCITAYQDRWPELEIGYSGHETGLATTVAAVALGAQYIERHITLDRASWGTDHAASVEPSGFARLVKDIRAVEESMGDGQKRIMPGEIESMRKLRGPSMTGMR